MVDWECSYSVADKVFEYIQNIYMGKLLGNGTDLKI
jgi:hypothetical protein